MISLLVKIALWSWKWVAVAKLLLRWRSVCVHVCVCVSAFLTARVGVSRGEMIKVVGGNIKKCGVERVWWDRTQCRACCLSYDLPVMWLPWEPNIQPQLFPYKTKLLWGSIRMLFFFFFFSFLTTTKLIVRLFFFFAWLLFFISSRVKTWASRKHRDRRCHFSDAIQIVSAMWSVPLSHFSHTYSGKHSWEIPKKKKKKKMCLWVLCTCATAP